MEHTHTPKKSFFETYQTFFALIICGLLIGGGIVVGRFIPTPSQSEVQQGQESQTSVRKKILKNAQELGLDRSSFATCLDTAVHKQKIADAVTLAEKSGVQGTPTFFIIKRKLDTSGKTLSQKQWSVLGARDLETFKESIATETSPIGQPPINGEKIVLSDTDHWIGPRDAKIVIVEYADIDCYYCKQAKPTLEKLLADHPEYAFVYRHSPIVSLHPLASYKAEATECAKDLGGENAFWDMLHTLSQ
jgi:protein-disulfide isomerase